MIAKVKLLLLNITILFVFPVHAQISKAEIQEIDNLFSDWKNIDSPGGTVGVMLDGQLVYSKAFGLASMEYKIPNNNKTIFNTGSVSKQFTAMGIIVLQQKGLLDFEDDIRKYIPELPDFKEKITISHLLHHTSGLRSMHSMLELAGWREEDSRTNDDLNRFIVKQKVLNFSPGSEYGYCNTGYMLLVNIVERVTGREFPDWMEETIFKPLGLNNTYIEGDYSKIKPNKATSYYGNKDNFKRAVDYWGYIGSGNMYSNNIDLLKWLENFHSPKKGWEKHFNLIQKLEKLNNGDLNNYAFGVIIDSIYGFKSISHSGSIGGFRSNITSFPDKKLSIVILSNFSKASPSSKSKQIFKTLFENEKAEKNNKLPKKYNILNISSDVLSRFEGYYWNTKEYYSRKIYLKRDTLYYQRTANNETQIVPISSNQFKLLGYSVDAILKFNTDENPKTVSLYVDGERVSRLIEYKPNSPNNSELSFYIGKFYSPELETIYEFYIKDNELYYHHPRHGDYKMRILKRDVFETEWPLSIVEYKRDENGTIIGINVSNGRVKNLWFKKVRF